MNQSDEDLIKIAEQMAKRMRAAGMSMKEAAEQFRQLGLAAKQLDDQLKKWQEATYQNELMDRLREWYGLEGADNQLVDEATKGLLGRALIELKMRWREYWAQVWS